MSFVLLLLSQRLLQPRMQLPKALGVLLFERQQQELPNVMAYSFGAAHRTAYTDYYFPLSTPGVPVQRLLALRCATARGGWKAVVRWPAGAACCWSLLCLMGLTPLMCSRCKRLGKVWPM